MGGVRSPGVNVGIDKRHGTQILITLRLTDRMGRYPSCLEDTPPPSKVTGTVHVEADQKAYGINW